MNEYVSAALAFLAGMGIGAVLLFGAMLVGAALR